MAKKKVEEKIEVDLGGGDVYWVKEYPIPQAREERFELLLKLLDTFRDGLIRYTEKGTQEIKVSRFSKQKERYEEAEAAVREHKKLPPVQVEDEEQRLQLEKERADEKKRLERSRDVEARLFLGVIVRKMNQMSKEIIEEVQKGSDVYVYDNAQTTEQKNSLGNQYKELYEEAMFLVKYFRRDRGRAGSDVDIDYVIAERFGEFCKPALCCITRVAKVKEEGEVKEVESPSSMSEGYDKENDPGMSIEKIYSNRYKTIAKAVRCIENTGSEVLKLAESYVQEHMGRKDPDKGAELISQIREWIDVAKERVQLMRNDSEYESVARELMIKLEALRDFKKEVLEPIEDSRKKIFYQERGYGGKNAVGNARVIMKDLKRELDWEMLEDGLDLIWDMAFVRVEKSVSLYNYREEIEKREVAKNAVMSR